MKLFDKTPQNASEFKGAFSKLFGRLDQPTVTAPDPSAIPSALNYNPDYFYWNMELDADPADT